ncbi:MAG TPA: hypothetical protein VNO21_13190, partial [Polyangiaceae bacterium]|nr:hypothetical protein [Polyangiaceae bacterium]
MTTVGTGLRDQKPLSLLQHVQNEILEEWRRRVRSETNELGFVRTEPALARYVPELLDRLIRAGDEVSSEMLVPSARFTEGCTSSEAVRELSLLRSTLLRVCARSGIKLSGLTVDLVHHEIDQAIAEVVSDIHRAACARLEASHRVERSLRENEDRMRLALSAAEVGTWEYRPQTGELTWDARVRELWGLPEEIAPTYELFL